MSAIRFYPIAWFEDAKWKSVQVVGRLENEKSVFLRIGFRPYFTVRYPESTDLDELENRHAYLMAETPVAEVTVLNVEKRIYRIYVHSKDDYYDTVSFYKRNGEGEILDEKQDIKSKFFSERRISPGAWQQATNLQTLVFNISSGATYTACDLEYFTQNITSIASNVPIPVGVNAFCDIEAIPSDDVSFPDAEAERPPDTIFAISLIVQNAQGTVNIIYVLTDKPLPNKYVTAIERTQVAYEVNIVKCQTEAQLLEQFFAGLQQYRPDRIITMNGRHFDINYIGNRARSLGVEIPPFTKLLKFSPYFYDTTIIQRKPFPSIDKVLALFTPGTAQIDLLDFYRRLYPQLGNHKLDTLGTVILGKGKTGLTIPELFARYRRGSVEDLSIIIDYSILDSILLERLWNKTQIDTRLSEMASFWKNDSEYVITTEKEDLFNDLLRYYVVDVPEKKYRPGKPPLTERKPGIYRDIYLYTLSPVYLSSLAPVAPFWAEYFQNTDDGIIPFKSGYFPTQFSVVEEYVRGQVPPNQLIWIEENSVAVQGQPQPNPGPVPAFVLVDFIPLILIANKSWILVSREGLIFKKGMSSFVRPPFPLIEKYSNYLVNYLLEHPNETIVLPQFETSLEDFELDAKVTSEDFSLVPKRKEAIISQMKELGLPVGQTWRRIKYIQTKQGPVIRDIYIQDPQKYTQLLDMKYYQKKLQEALDSVLAK